MRPRRPIVNLPLVSLFISAALLAAAVDRWSPAPASPTLASVGYGEAATHLGSRAYPREAIDSDGFRVRIPAPPRRIVSQSWSIDEYLYAVVPPERVVGVSDSAYLAGVSNVLPWVRSFRPVLAADPERVLRQNPDLIIVSSSSRSDFTGLIRTSGIPVYRMFIDFTTLAQVEEYTRLMGYLTGEDDRAEAAIQRFRAAIDHAKSLRKPGAPAPRIMGYSGSYGYGDKTLMHDIILQIGGRDIAAENGAEGYNQINAEQLARWNPDWIVSGCATGQAAQVKRRLLADPGIALTTAGRTGHILVLENNVFLPMSPYAAARVTAMAETIWEAQEPPGAAPRAVEKPLQTCPAAPTCAGSSR
jgi:iron complex transport system substrate-binding protein